MPPLAVSVLENISGYVQKNVIPGLSPHLSMSFADVEIRCHNFQKYFVEANFMNVCWKVFFFCMVEKRREKMISQMGNCTISTILFSLFGHVGSLLSFFKKKEKKFCTCHSMFLK
jgi:hypothetical protein